MEENTEDSIYTQSAIESGLGEYLTNEKEEVVKEDDLEEEDDFNEEEDYDEEVESLTDDDLDDLLFFNPQVYDVVNNYKIHKAVKNSQLPKQFKTFAKQAIEEGENPNVILGLLGNIKVESSFDANAVGDGGLARGLYQHHPDRQVWIKQRIRQNYASLPYEQALFLAGRDELKLNYPKVYQKALAAKNPGESALIIRREFEIPKVVTDEASQFAEQYANELDYNQVGDFNPIIDWDLMNENLQSQLVHRNPMYNYAKDDARLQLKEFQTRNNNIQDTVTSTPEESFIKKADTIWGNRLDNVKNFVDNTRTVKDLIGRGVSNTASAFLTALNKVKKEKDMYKQMEEYYRDDISNYNQII